MSAHIEMVPISGSAVEERCDTIHVSMKMRKRNSSFFMGDLALLARYIEKGQKGQKG